MASLPLLLRVSFTLNAWPSGSDLKVDCLSITYML